MSNTNKKLAARTKAVRRHNERLNAEGFLFPSRVASTLVVMVVIGLAYVWLHNSSEARWGARSASWSCRSRSWTGASTSRSTTGRR
ncbi:MAG: hypothetical protein U1G05_08550 [Kiritimatiellia bacterium]